MTNFFTVNISYEDLRSIIIDYFREIENIELICFNPKIVTPCRKL